MSDRPHFIDATHRESDDLDRLLSLPSHASGPARPQAAVEHSQASIEKAIAAPRKASSSPPAPRTAPARKKTPPPVKSVGGVPVKLTADEAAVIERVLRRAGGGAGR